MYTKKRKNAFPLFANFQSNDFHFQRYLKRLSFVCFWKYCYELIDCLVYLMCFIHGYHEKVFSINNSFFEV